MITSIIFSKDRALQLDLLLKSIKQNFKHHGQIRVIYKTSNDRYEEAYKKLRNEHRKVLFLDQFDLFKNILTSCCVAPDKYITFFTDDNIVYQEFDAQELIDCFDAQSCCFSLRLGLNTYARDIGGKMYQDILPTEAKLYADTLTWDRTALPYGGYWNYPLSVDGHVFRKDTIFDMVDKLNTWSNFERFQETPNEFESKLQRFNFEIPPFMTCFRHSKVVNSPNNRVQTQALNRFGNVYEYSPEYCNELYLQGRRLKLEDIDFSQINSPHTELKLINE